MIKTAMTDEVIADPILGPVIKNLPIPANRSGQPEEIAEFLTFLLGPHARFFVGSILFCDGGTDAQARPTAWPAAIPS